jgi:hypothetical protein
MLIAGWPQQDSCAAVSSLTAANFRSVAASDLLALGPVEQVSVKTAEIRVLGQLAVVPALQRNMVSEELVGRMVAVYGELNANGSLKVSGVAELGMDYVPGATELFVKGVVRAVNQANATARLGSLSISYSGALHTLNADDIAAGKVVALSGLEFANAGSFYADNGVVSAAKPMGQAGSDKSIAAKPAGQAGSDLVGQAGSDLAGQAGSDKSIAAKPAGQAGSDLAGQAGSDLAGQAGSDKSIAAKPAGQAGSDLAGQAGSDLAGQAGSDKSIAAKPAGQAGSDLVGQAGSDVGQAGSDLIGQAGSD